MGETFVLLSYPRSGNTLVSFFLEEATGRPTSDHGILRSLGTADPSLRPLVLKTHAYRFHYPPKWRIAPTLMVVRNPYEAISRHVLKTEDGAQWSDNLAFYRAVIAAYRAVPARKEMVYYEDLVEDFDGTMRRVFDFARVPAERLDGMDADAMRGRSIQAYTRWMGPSQTGGEKVDYHWDATSERLRDTWGPEIAKLVADNADILGRYSR